MLLPGGLDTNPTPDLGDLWDRAKDGMAGLGDAWSESGIGAPLTPFGLGLGSPALEGATGAAASAAAGAGFAPSAGSGVVEGQLFDGMY